MNSARLNQLLTYREESPDDPFILYALAMEYQSENPAEAENLFQELLQKHADYLPTYYQAAAFYEQQGKLTEALRLYRAGMALAKRQNDLNTLKELNAAYQLLSEDL